MHRDLRAELAICCASLVAGCAVAACITFACLRFGLAQDCAALRVEYYVYGAGALCGIAGAVSLLSFTRADLAPPAAPANARLVGALTKPARPRRDL